MVNRVAARVCLGGGVGVGVGVPVAGKFSDNCQMASMVWAPKQAKGEVYTGLSRASARRLDVLVAALVEDVSGMIPLRGGNYTFFLCALPVSPAHILGSIGSGVGPFQCTTFPCNVVPMFASAVASHG